MNEKMYIPPDLIHAIAEGRCVLFVGSGLSRHTHALPVWGEFIRRVRNTLSHYHGEDIDASEENVKEYPLEYLEYVKERFAVQYLEAVKEELVVPSGTPIQEAHKLIASLPWAAIVTTNLDTLLENALKDQGQRFVTVDTEEGFSNVGLSSDAILLLKMHGCITKSEAQVLTRFEYLEFDQRRHAMKAVVLSLFTQFPTLILGAGLTDPNFLKIYGISHSALERFKPRAFYVAANLPKFVQDVWDKRRLCYVEVHHTDLTDWLDSLNRRVAISRANRLAHSPSACVNLYLKEESLMSLGQVLHDYNALQQRYLDQVHILDYGWFTIPWEQTLYSKLRAAVSRAIRTSFGDRPGKHSLLYIAPGPHAPLFAADKENWLRRQINKIWILDILPSVVGAAVQNLRNELSDEIDVSGIVADLTGGCGDALCNVLNELIVNNSEGEEVFEALDDMESIMGRILSEEIIQQVASAIAERCHINDEIMKADITYSEMVAAFTATPPIMGFRSALFAKFAPAVLDRELLNKIMHKAEQIWRVFNDRFFVLHLSLLSRVTKPEGLILVALDVEKRFDDKAFSSVQSFSDAEPKLPEQLRLQRDTRLESEFLWRDHAHSFEVKVAGVSVQDFLSHQHLVKLYAYKQLTPTLNGDSLEPSGGSGFGMLPSMTV